MLTHEEIFLSVENINDLIVAGQFDERDFEEHYYLNLITDGFCCNIKFLGKTIWRSDEDEREFIEEKDEYEPLIDFLKRKYNQEIERIQKQKLA